MRGEGYRPAEDGAARGERPAVLDEDWTPAGTVEPEPGTQVGVREGGAGADPGLRLPPRVRDGLAASWL
jgi:hypothetical protein